MSMNTMSTLYDYGSAQLHILEAMLREVCDNGYIVVRNQMNTTGLERDQLYTGHAENFASYVRVAAKHMKLQPIVVEVDPIHDTVDLSVPHRVGMLPIRSAMDMMSGKHISEATNNVALPRSLPKKSRSLIYHQPLVSGITHYRGWGQAALDSVVAVLDMPQHRKILTSPITRGR